jgi:hypothetical protein
MLPRSWLAALLLAALAPLPAQAAVINEEFKFTAYTGDKRQDQVQAVPGRARVYLNNVLVAEQQVSGGEMPVLFDDREISPSVWLPVASLGPRLRKGQNRVRIEFEPVDPALAYHAQLSWAAVNDQATESSSGLGQSSATNQSGEGMEQRDSKGRLVLERAFDAPFAADLPWHHYPAVSALSAEDKAALLALLQARAQAFAPKFEPLYAILGGVDGLDMAQLRKLRCLDKGYAAGLRVGAPAPEQVDFIASGQPEVMLQARGQSLYALDFDLLRKKIKDEKTQECLGTVLMTLYGPQAAAVHDPAGGWKLVY